MLLGKAQHRRLHSAFEKPFFTFVWEVRQEEEEKEAKQGAEEEGAAERTGEDLCHPSGYNKETARAVSLIKISLVTNLKKNQNNFNR